MGLTRRYRQYMLWALVFCCTLLEAGTASAAKPIRVVFRFDDPSAGSNTELETRLIAAFREHHMCCTWCVIPFPLLAGKAELFGEAARAGVLEIALHGYAHETDGRRPGELTEFVGLAWEVQWQKIQQGKKSLEAELRPPTPITVFAPPWNGYDAETVRALEAAQFRCLSASLLGWADAATTVALLPVTCSIAEVQRAVVGARAIPDPAPVIVVGFHAFDFHEDNKKLGVITFDQFVATLEWLTRQPDVTVMRMSEVTDLSPARYLANQHIQMGVRWLPRRLQGRPACSLAFLSEEGARRVGHRGRLRLVGFYGGGMLMVGAAALVGAGWVFKRWPGWVSRLLEFSGPALLAGAWVWAFPGGHFGGRIRMLAALLGATAWCAGISAAWLRRKIRAA